VQKQVRRDKEMESAHYVEMMKRLDKVEYRAFTAEQELQQLGR
jgi:tetrahydromethanopterin S-methyltransferase subunit G